MLTLFAKKYAPRSNDELNIGPSDLVSSEDCQVLNILNIKYLFINPFPLPCFSSTHMSYQSNLFFQTLISTFLIIPLMGFP